MPPETLQRSKGMCVVGVCLWECVHVSGMRGRGEECAFVAAPRHLGLKCHAKELPRSREGIARDRGGWPSPKLQSFALCPGISRGAAVLTAAQLETDLEIKGVSFRKSPVQTPDFSHHAPPPLTGHPDIGAETSETRPSTRNLDGQRG